MYLVINSFILWHLIKRKLVIWMGNTISQKGLPTTYIIKFRDFGNIMRILNEKCQFFKKISIFGEKINIFVEKNAFENRKYNLCS